MSKVLGSQLILSAFPRDGRTWQVVGHGKIRAPTEVDESACEVFLAEEGWDKPCWTEPPTTVRLSTWLGVGQLLLAPVGSLWRDGVYAGQMTRQQNRVEIVGASRKWPSGQLGTTTAYQGSPRAPWTPVYPIDPGVDLPLICVLTADGGVLWVSALELAKATFGVTSQWLRLMIEGGIEVWPELRGRIIDPKRSARYGDGGRSLKLWAYRGLDDLDILAAARVCADAGLGGAFKHVAASLRSSGFAQNPAHVRIPFPFRGPSTWTIEEQWIGAATAEGPPRKRRLITRVVSIEYELGIDHVRVFHPGQVETEDDGLEIEADRQRSQFRAKGDITDSVRVITGQASWSALGVMQRNSSNQRTAGRWTVEHVPVEAVEAAAGKTKVVPVEGPIKTATTAGYGTKSERGGRLAIKLNVKDQVQAKMDLARSPLARVASTIASLRQLSGALEREFHIVAPRDGPGADPNDTLWRYPLDDGSRKLHWATTKEGRQRRALVARMKGRRGWIYFFEAEHLEIEGEVSLAGSPTIIGQDGYSALCVTAIAGEDLLSADMIGDVLRTNAIARGVWRRPALAIPMTTVRRANAWLHDHGAYARAIGRAIRRLEGELPAEALA